MSTILVVDSDGDDAERYRKCAGQLGMESVICANANEALELLGSQAAGVVAAVVLWELEGDVPGPQLIARIARSGPGMPVVAVSGRLDLAVGARAAALGAAGLVQKPLDTKEIVNALREAIRSVDASSPIYDALRENIIGSSRPFLAALRSLARAISHGEPRLLLTGESGTGKEVFARAAHDLGPGKGEPMVAVNVTAIPRELLETELFGHEKGAFTDAKRQRVGSYEAAGEGTLFLDEIGDLDLNLQVKILRAVETKKFRRVGGNEEIAFRARLICATNADLRKRRTEGLFRDDLYYRIAQYEVRIPPLRERGDDVLTLAEHFIQLHSGASQRRLSRSARGLLSSYPYPGNVRELENIIRRALTDSDAAVIQPTDLPLESMAGNVELDLDLELDAIELPARLLDLPLAEATMMLEHALDRKYLPRRFHRAGRKVGPAAKDAEVDPKTFRRRWGECGLGDLRSGQEYP